MILDSQCSPDKGLDEHALDPEMLAGSLTHKEELRRLKLKLGSWSLAPQLVTAETMWKQLLIVTLVRPSWTSHAKQAREVKTAQEVQDYTAANALGGWAQELFALIDNGFHGLEKLYSAHRYTADNEQACLDMHFSFLRLLLSNRAQSLASCYMLPPNRYAGGLAADGPGVGSIVEGRSLGSCELPPLELMHFRLSTVVRMLLVAQERDGLTGGAEALHLLKVCCCHIGDSRLIENTHQKAKEWQVHVHIFQMFEFLSCWSSVEINPGSVDSEGVSSTGLYLLNQAFPARTVFETVGTIACLLWARCTLSSGQMCLRAGASLP